MIVCVCKRVNSAQVREAVHGGASTLEDVSRTLGLGTGCGRCLEFAQQLVEDESRSLAYEVEVA